MLTGNGDDATWEKFLGCSRKAGYVGYVHYVCAINWRFALHQGKIAEMAFYWRR